MTDSLDLAKVHKDLYRPGRTPGLVDVPEFAYLMIDGEGYPGTSEAWREAMEALYSVSYTLRFAKKAGGFVYKVMPLEGLWWAEDMDVFLEGDKGAWLWTAMIVQPDECSAEDLEAAMETAAAKKDLPAIELMRHERWAEGRAAQVMYLGPYSDEGPTIAALHDFIAEQGLARRGKHHEIYLGDPRKSAPEKLKTVIRQPVGPG